MALQDVGLFESLVIVTVMYICILSLGAMRTQEVTSYAVRPMYTLRSTRL